MHQSNIKKYLSVFTLVPSTEQISKRVMLGSEMGRTSTWTTADYIWGSTALDG
jgi:hypothetical protein